MPHEVTLRVANARRDAANDAEACGHRHREIVVDSRDRLVAVEREPGCVRGGARGVRPEPGDRSGFSIARPEPACPALVRDVTEHRAEALERARAGRGLALGEIEAVQAERDERDMAYLARAGEGGDRPFERRQLHRDVGRRRGRRLGHRGLGDDRRIHGHDRAAERHGRRRDRSIARRLLRGELHRWRDLGQSWPRVLAYDELTDDGFERRRVDELLLREESTADRPGEVAPVGVTVTARRGERLQNNHLELRGHLRGKRARRLDAAFADDFEQRVAMHGTMQRAASERLPEDDAESIQIASSVDLLSARLLGRHVPEFPLQDSLLGREHLGARDAEIGNLHGALEREEDVLRGHVAVDDLERPAPLVLPLVRVVEPLRGLRDDPRRHPRIEAPPPRLRAREEPAEVRPFDVLHCEELPLVSAVVELVDLHHVRVVEAGGELRLLDEHRPESERRPVRRQDSLHHEHLVGALCAALLREEDLRHASSAEAPDHLERGQLLRGGAGCGEWADRHMRPANSLTIVPRWRGGRGGLAVRSTFRVP